MRAPDPDPGRAGTGPDDDAPGDRLTALDDGALLEQVFTRGDRPWRELLRRYRALMFRCIHKVAERHEAHLGPDDVNEIFGEVCCNLLRDDLRKLRAWDPARGSKLSTWLGLIAMNTAYDVLRTCRRRPVLDKLELAPERPAPGPSALDELIDRERWIYLSRLLADFSEKDRRFVELYYARGLAPEAVAAAMRISVKTVYSKKNKLRSKLEAIARTDPDAPPSGEDAVAPPLPRRVRRAA